MKIEAGWKLWPRKPIAAPAVIAASTPAGPLPRSNATIDSAIAEIPQTPAASPSMPSDRLTTLMIATKPSDRQRLPGAREIDMAEEREREVVDARRR